MKFLTHLLSKNPFVKIAGVFLILYFGVYKYDKSPDSLAKRLNKETISEDFEIATNQTKKIFNAVLTLKELKQKKDVVSAKNAAEIQKKKNNSLRSQVAMVDSFQQEVTKKVQDNEEVASCNDSVSFSYEIKDGEGNILLNKKNQLVKISAEEDIFFERVLFGMSKGEVRQIWINEDREFISTAVRRQLLSSTTNNIVIKVKIMSLFKKDLDFKDKKPLTESQKLICSKK